MMNKSDFDFKVAWAKYPFARILLPYVLGIVLSEYIPIQMKLCSWIAFSLLIGLIVIHVFSKKYFDHGPLWFGVFSFLFWFVTAFGWTLIRDERNLPRHYSTSRNTILIARTYYLEEKDRFWDCYSTVIAQLDSAGSKSVNGKILIRIPKSYNHTPAVRDVYLGKFSILIPDGPSAPFEFDWKTMLHRRNIHQLTYADTFNFKIIEHAKQNYLEQWRSKLDTAIRTIIPSTRDYPVASAMLIGLRKKMDPELYRAYSATGAVHVLSVSGMHVGILAGILELIFGFYKSRSKTARVIRPVMMLSIIWIYTFLTGATPSILRSALMFTSFILARQIQRDAAPMNILAGTAFILLIFNPFDLYAIGFQLSFGAMAGIFLFYEPIRQLINTTIPFLQIIWKIMAVGMAAELMIYPVVGYHFHQFAFYFWLTGLVSSPFSFVILVGGMVALPIFFLNIPFLHFFYLPLVFSIKWMNDIISWVYTLPLGRVQGWWPDLLECFLLILLSIVSIHWMTHRTFKTAIPTLVTLNAFMLYLIVQEIREQKSIELIASNNRNQPKIWLKNQKSIIQVYGDSSLIKSDYVEKYNIQPENIIKIFDCKLTFKNERITISPDYILLDSTKYTWITKRSDTLLPDSDQFLIFLSKIWRHRKSEVVHPIQIYTPSFIDRSMIHSLFPNSKIHISEKDYIQIPSR